MLTTLLATTLLTGSIAATVRAVRARRRRRRALALLGGRDGHVLRRRLASYTAAGTAGPWPVRRA